jgi:hypothetical protein
MDQGTKKNARPGVTAHGSRLGRFAQLTASAVLMCLGGMALPGCGGGNDGGTANGCSTGAQEAELGCVEQSVSQCLQRKPSIGSGTYGCVTSSDDVGPPQPATATPSFVLEVFDTNPPPTPDDGLTPVASAKTDSMGFFEIALAPGSHWLCTSFRRCTPVTITDGATKAQNYALGESVGFW